MFLPLSVLAMHEPAKQVGTKPDRAEPYAGLLQAVHARRKRQDGGSLYHGYL